MIKIMKSQSHIEGKLAMMQINIENLRQELLTYFNGLGQYIQNWKDSASKEQESREDSLCSLLEDGPGVKLEEQESSNNLQQVSTSNKKVKQTNKEGGYACGQCDKMFPRAYELQRHVKFVHTTSNDYRCDRCQRSYKWRDSLVKHSKTCQVAIDS